MNDSIFFTLNTQFKKHKDDKYYLDYIDYKTIDSVNSMSQKQDFEQSWDSSGKTGNIYTTMQFVVSKIGKFENIRWMDEISTSKDLYDLPSKAKDPFWKNYNYPAIITSSKKMILELSDGKSERIKYLNE